ncbi:C3a anaphylatoxin chemotactic receptor-like [Ostrea edulis]|uniref:C3a anaphylatoxin chemotactic receptor-like n=1 Tax=Ostrea edulis TaxID=37623 RepID=UPI0024AF2C4F|nr:C3a anaphylatoxin chemotactic receptor-like [Ostrea edulis]XP_048764306.2 C3a anaphylatoxin chemotactic receptor-like [Ostrea edulis]XP_056019428.1 C3a anaphylatoxin chemotactic receptor-like [Ostrea edulis]XP_056019429.1 C3a anaphylatoxin chemotactic receptor-like [Ostrea edulis]XP_056019430.1 C3a anaphylatoxin chemotactic receptor-like [Ostrea edulis]
MDNSTGIISNTSRNIYQTLEEVNASKAEQRLPTVIFLVFLIIVGLIGNTVVIVAYSLKYPPSTFRLYILTLAVLDFLSCLIPMPLEVVDNAYPVMFYNEEFCKSGRFFGNVLKIGSAFVLVVMAAGRYKKICHPYSKPTPLLVARLLCAASIVLAIALSWPNAIIQGIKHVYLPGNITGFDCSIDDVIRGTKYPFIYSTTLFVVYVIVFLLLTVLYSLVIFALQRHAKKQTTRNLNERLNKLNPRITKLMIAITVAFILCYLPNCLLDAISTFKRGNIFPPSPIVLGTLPLLARAFFINNVINPFIYLIGESKFRNIVKQSLRWLYYTVCCPKEKQKQRFAITESFRLTEVKSNDSG